jgi:hypothetical protein
MSGLYREPFHLVFLHYVQLEIRRVFHIEKLEFTAGRLGTQYRESYISQSRANVHTRKLEFTLHSELEFTAAGLRSQ